MNSFGVMYRVTIIGSSHGNLIGVVIDGIPPGFPLNINLINQELTRRRPGQSNMTTNRKERDEVVIETGTFRGKTTGDPLVAYVRNQDVDSSYYEDLKDHPRPGHADYTAKIKYRGANDYRGGGRFSGRLTAGLVIAGAIARQILSNFGIKVISHAKEIGGIQARVAIEELDEEVIYSPKNLVRTGDANAINPMIRSIEEARSMGDSIGGIVECGILNLPVGVGEPFFDSIESVIAHVMFSIPAVKGVEFGSGFNAARMRGSHHNDLFAVNDEGKVITLTNNAGGILGGISNGMPVIFRVAFKPPSSISIPQETLHLKTGKRKQLKVRGRHDPCIVPRAVPVVTNAAAMAILDLILRGGFLKQ